MTAQTARRVLVVCLLLGVASPGSARAEPPAAPPNNAQVVLKRADARVGTYVSIPWGFETRSYWIEGPEGLILIDTQFLISAGVEAVEWAERLTGKKVALAVILHANPDKFNGTAALQKRGIKVVTSAQVAKLIGPVHALRKRWFYERYKPDFPAEAPTPDVFGARTTQLSAGGVTITAHVLGEAASGAHVVVQFDDHLFVGDLVGNDTHAWIELGHLDAWIAVLKRLQRLKPDSVHPGRGPGGSGGLLADQIVYLEHVLAVVRAAKPFGKPTEAQLEALKKQIVARYPGYENDFFLDIGLEAVWKANARPR